jgi:hypothetical protein
MTCGGSADLVSFFEILGERVLDAIESIIVSQVPSIFAAMINLLVVVERGACGSSIRHII